MFESIVLGDDWAGVDVSEEPTVASWASETRPLRIDVHEIGAEDDHEIAIELVRQIEADGYTASVTTYRAAVEDVDDAADVVEDLVVDLDADVGSGPTQGITAIGAEVVEPFVHFYCVFEDELPPGVEPDDLVFEDDADATVGSETVSALDVDESAIDPDESVCIDIYPVHESMVDTEDNES